MQASADAEDILQYIQRELETFQSLDNCKERLRLLHVPSQYTFLTYPLLRLGPLRPIDGSPVEDEKTSDGAT